MDCCRTLFGLTLVIRAGFHLLVGAYAAVDLKDIYDKTSGTFTQLALKWTHAQDFVVEFEFPLVFYVFCGASLLVLCCVYPWKGAGRNSLTVYATLHVLYVAAVVYVVFIRTIVSMAVLRKEYEIMAHPGLWPASLVLDVLTFVAAMVPSEKGRSYTSVLPQHRVMVFSPPSHGQGVVTTALPPYTQFHNPVVLRDSGAPPPFAAK